MDKKNKQDLADVIDDMGDLETTMAQHAHYHGEADKATILGWFNTLNQLTSKLDKVWKAEGNTP